MTTSTPAPSATTIVALERRTKRGLMPSLYLAPGVQDGTPDVVGLYAKVELTVNGQLNTLELSHMPTDEPGVWGIDSFWRGSFPIHANGFGARYLIVSKASPALTAQLNAATAEAGL